MKKSKKSNTRNIFLIFILLVSAFSFTIGKSAFSQPEGPTTYRIVGIDTEGNELYDSRTIVAYSGLNINQEITIPSDETRDAIKRLWNLGLFSDIKLSIDKKFGNDVYLVIEVEELPRIERIYITGNDELSDDDIMEKIDIVTGEVLSE